MTYDLVFRAGARRDVRSLYSFVATQAGRAIADSYIERIEAACRRLTTFPFSGAPREDVGAGIRMLAVERRALVAYRVVENRVEIVAIAYAGRVLTAQLVRR